MSPPRRRTIRGALVSAAAAAEAYVDETVDDAAVARVVALARSYGPLRAVSADQAPVVRAATEHNRHLLPKWQRHGDGIHEWAEPHHYSHGRTWIRTARPLAGPCGRVQWRRETYTGRPHVNWRSRDHWLDLVVPTAIKLRPDALHTRRGTVTADRLAAYCRELSKHANPSTGRRCIVRVDRLAELLGVSKSTVQRCQLAAEDLGLYVVTSPGRMLTAEETYQARRRGSCQRGMANDAALVVPSWIPHEAIDGPHPARRRGHDTPTSGGYSKSGNLLIPTSFSRQPRSAGRTEPPPAARHRRKGSHPQPQTTPQEPQSGAPSAPQRVYDPLALDVARGLSQRLPWLRDTAPGRLEPMLRRFVRCRRPWAARDVVEAIDQINARLRRASMTHHLVKNPPALLASYLRDLDVDADHPRGWMDVEDLTRTPVSATQRRNQLLLEIHRQGGSAGLASSQTRAAALAQIRAELARHQGETGRAD